MMTGPLIRGAGETQTWKTGKSRATARNAVHATPTATTGVRSVARRGVTRGETTAGRSPGAGIFMRKAIGSTFTDTAGRTIGMSRFGIRRGRAGARRLDTALTRIRGPKQSRISIFP